MATDRPKGHATIRFAGFFFLLSALLELVSISSAVPLFGAMRGGAVGVAYHVVYVAAFGVMGLGLWRTETWGPSAIFAGTTLFSMDRLAYLLGDPTLGYGEFSTLLDPALVRPASIAVTVISLACWWGFAGYIYMRRDSFAG